jgi:hypothetical protein
LDNGDEIQTVENQNTVEEFTQESSSDESVENNEDAPVVDEPAAEVEGEFAKKDEEDEDDKEEENVDTDTEDKKEEEDEDSKKKFELLEAEHAELQAKYAALEASYQELVKFKNDVEDKEKDDLIASFYMLTADDKADIIKNKANYSLKEIKAELSMICVDKKVSFGGEVTSEKPVTYNLSQTETVSLPASLKAVEETQKRLNK